METDIQIVKVPVYVGGYRMQQFRFNFTKKPNWFHRTMMKLFFGFVWEDNE